MLRSICLALLIFTGIASADVQNGVVRYQGQTVPGATVTAECGKDTDKITTVTDDAGRFEMGGLPSTSCKYTILMFGFEPLQKDATASATPLAFDLSMQKVASIPVAPSATPVVTSAAPAVTPAAQPPAPSQASAPDLGQRPSLTGGNGQGGRGNQANGRGGQGSGRGGQNGRGGGFQSLSLTQNADATASDSPASLLGGDNGGTGSGASDAFTVNGTLSQGVQAQAGDGMGMGGPGGFGFGPGGPGGFGGPGGPGGDFGGGGDRGGGGRGGDGGGRGGQGFAGGGGPGGGGFGGPGGGGFGGGGGGRGGGGFGGPGGPGGRGGRGPNGVTSFGNRAGRGRGPQWQASITYNFANSALNARPYSFASQTTTPVKAATANNELGFTLGGPLMIPHTKFNLKNSRWNLNVTGARNRIGVDDISSVPSAAMRTGDFGTTTILDPNNNGAAFTNNIIPQSRLSPTALALLSNPAYLPDPTGSGLRNNFQLIANNPSNTNNVNLQISDPITTKDRLNINLSRQGRSSDQVQSFGYRDPINGWGGNLSIAYSRTITATTVNTLTLSGNRNVTNNCSYFLTPGINPSFCPESSALEAPSITFQNFNGLSDNTPSTNHSTQAGLSDSVAKTKGKHNMQFGVTNNKRYTNSLTASNARGQYSFSSVNPDGTGYDFADFLLGLPSGGSANQYLNGDDNFYYRQFNMAAFFNDDYRLSTNFTLNGGLRWEYFTPETEKYNHMANVTIAPDGLSAALVTPGENDPNTGGLTPDGLIHGDWKMYEPQIGFAYKPWSKKAIVFRGGYGIRYNGGALQTQGGKLAIQPPFVNTVSLTSTTTPNLPFLLTGPNATAASGEISNTYALAPNYVPARAQQWNAIVQYTFMRSYVFQISYFGTKGSDLDVLLGPNRDIPVAGQKIGLPGPISYMSSTIQLDESIGNSIFHSGQAQLTRRFARGLSGSATYTLQKSIDDSSTLGGGVVQIENDIQAERALSPNIPHQTLGINFNYQTLAGNQKSEFYWNIIRGWQLFGGYNLTSGAPFTATISGDVSGTGIVGSARAEATGLPVEDGSGYFNPAAFAVPANGTYGDAGRDTIPGIWNFTMNGSAMRSFRIGERRRLALTFSTQNPLNHPSITGISTVIGSQTLLPGTPTSAGNMRTVTAQARFTF